MIILLAVLVALVLWVISVQRDLVTKDENCKNAMSQIGVQQSSRWDALTAIADLVRSYDEHEYNTLRDVIGMRQGITGKSSAEEVEAQEQAMAQAMKAINVVVERYPELKANDNYKKAMDDVNTYENQVRMSRMVYNDTVTLYNRLIRMFPSSFVASIFHFDMREYLEVEKEKTAMPSMKIH
ncbi:MAG: LemA family protein [Bacteroidales bacterium]|nr:LemA family protein [Bacteroidales bacterium]